VFHGLAEDLPGFGEAAETNEGSRGRRLCTARNSDAARSKSPAVAASLARRTMSARSPPAFLFPVVVRFLDIAG